MLVKLTHVYGFCTGALVPASHVKGPFSVRRPLSELHPGPPLNQMVTSSAARGFEEGKNLRGTLARNFVVYHVDELVPEEELSCLVWGV